MRSITSIGQAVLRGIMREEKVPDIGPYENYAFFGIPAPPRYCAPPRGPRPHVKGTPARLHSSRSPPPVIVVTSPEGTAEPTLHDSPKDTSCDRLRKTFRDRPLPLTPAGPRGPCALPSPPPSPLASSSSSSSTSNTSDHLSESSSKTSEDLAREFKEYFYAARTELWENFKGPIPEASGFAVIVPSSSTRKEFSFGPGMRYADMYGGLVNYLASETVRPCAEPLVLLSKYYPEAIYDVESYGTWVAWTRVWGRPAEECTLLAV